MRSNVPKFQSQKTWGHIAEQDGICFSELTDRTEGSRAEVASDEDLFFWSYAFVLIEWQINIHITEGRLVQKPFLNCGRGHYWYWRWTTVSHVSVENWACSKASWSAKLHILPTSTVYSISKGKAKDCVDKSCHLQERLPRHELHSPLALLSAWVVPVFGNYPFKDRYHLRKLCDLLILPLIW